jgi:hypothetical protein
MRNFIEKTKNYIEFQKNKKINGCGPWWIPNVFRCRFFAKNCNLHDLDYREGGSEKDRQRADKDFKQAMELEIKTREEKGTLSPICKVYRTCQKSLFYTAVRCYGLFFFKYK